MGRRPFLALALACASCLDVSSSEPTAASSYAGVSIHADLAPAEGHEVVQATVGEVVVKATSGKTLAKATAYEPLGSADEVVAIRVTDGLVGSPLVVVTTTLGGRRESATLVTLYRFDARAHSLAPAFSGATVEVDGDARAEGALLILPKFVLHRAPRAELARLYAYDEATGQYIAKDITVSRTFKQ